MHALLTSLLLLVAAASLLAGVLLKASRFAAGCWRARRLFVSSPVPGPQPASRLIGHATQIMGPKNAWVFTQWANKYGPLLKLQLLDQFVLVLTDPDSIMQITRRGGGPHSAAYMPKARVVYQPLELAVKPRQRNIVTSEDGPYWRAVRQGTAPCFSMTNLRKVVPLLVELSQRVADHMAATQQPPGGAGAGAAGSFLVDVSDAARRITSDVMGFLLFAEDLGGTRWADCPYLDVFYHVLKAQAVLVTNPLFLWQLWRADARHARRCFKQHNDMMAAKISALLSQPPPDYTIAAHLLRVIDPATGQPLEPNKLKAEVAAFMAAGHETTSHAITWCLATLAVHPEVQQQVYEELAAAGLASSADRGSSSPSSARSFAASDYGRLPLLSAVIKEGLRLLPPTPLGGVRICTTDDTQLCGYSVPKATLVNIPSLPLALAQHTFGPDAMLFKPQRWLAPQAAEQTVSAGSSDSSDSGCSAAATSSCSSSSSAGQTPLPLQQPDPLTFSAGVRDCLGQSLAKLELQVVLATLLGRFRFTPGPALQQEVAMAAATGEPPIAAVYALAECHVTLQPTSGSMMLSAEQR